MPLDKLQRLFLGILLSDSKLLDDHVDHQENGTLGNIFDCGRCRVYEKKARERELAASLVMAKHLKSLKYIGWSTCFFWDRTIAQKADTEDGSVIEDVAGNELVDIASSTRSTSNSTNDQRNVGLTTELLITRARTKIIVERVV